MKTKIRIVCELALLATLAYGAEKVLTWDDTQPFPFGGDFLRSGILPMTGNLNVGGQAVTNASGVNNANGVPITLPVGAIQMYGGATAPSGWLLCDGANHHTNTYPQLYEVIGYTFGGSGTNFILPDMRGVFPKGAGTTARAAGKDASGAYYTATLGAYGLDRFQAHAHNMFSDKTAGTNDNVVMQGATLSYNCTAVNQPRIFSTYGTPRVATNTEPQSLTVTFIIFAGK